MSYENYKQNFPDDYEAYRATWRFPHVQWYAVPLQIVCSIFSSIFLFRRCNLCRRLFHVNYFLADHMGGSWARCPYCREYGSPRDGDGMTVFGFPGKNVW